MGWIILGSGQVGSGCRVTNLGPRLTRDTVGSGRVGFGFLVVIFGLSWWAGFFLSLGENFDMCLSHRMMGSGFLRAGWVGFIGSSDP
jgi:hypothetical protein